MAEAESPAGVIELGRGDAEIEQDAVHPRHAGPGDEFREPAEPAVQDAKTRVIYFSSRGHRLRVAVEREQPAGLPQLRQDQPAMPATTERAVDVAAVAAHIQTVYCLLGKDRGM